MGYIKIHMMQNAAFYTNFTHNVIIQSHSSLSVNHVPIKFCVRSNNANPKSRTGL